MYGVKWKNQNWTTPLYSSTTGTTERADLQYRSIAADSKRAHFIEVYFMACTNGGGWVWSRGFGKNSSYENNGVGARYGSYGDSYTINYVRLQPSNYFNTSGQGMRGNLKVEQWS